jgi:trehalose/maltose hydrolase-like predicted phosphorylase
MGSTTIAEAARRRTEDDSPAWTLRFDGYSPRDEPAREVLCALGNGKLVTRAAAEESAAGGSHYPGTYLAGGYNRLQSNVRGRRLEHESLVNWPNWLALSFRPYGGEWLDLDLYEVLALHQELHLREGSFVRVLRVRDREGRITSIRSRRLVHLEERALVALEWILVPENWSGDLELASGLDAGTQNALVRRYRGLRGDHLRVVDVRAELTDLSVLAECSQARTRVAEAARTRVEVNGDRWPVSRWYRAGSAARHDWMVSCSERSEVRVEKICAIVSDLDHAVSSPLYDAVNTVRAAPGFERLLETNRSAWARLWSRFDIEIGSDEHVQRAVRTFIFHLLQTLSPQSSDDDVGATARGLHGEAYHGHVFWDELFLFPMFNLRHPDSARALLMYRYRRLGRARSIARALGLPGAVYPWCSGTEGRSETPHFQQNPLDGNWYEDDTHLQRHVNAAVALNVWRYVQVTQDWAFMSAFGAEMILEIARGFAGLAKPRPGTDRFEIHGVVGPDEFHVRYMGAESAGIRNNAYTNVMASWTLRRACALLERLPAYRRDELMAQLSMEPAEIEHWKRVADRMFVPFMDDGIIEQFEGYADLEELDWEAYRRRYGDIRRMDWILRAERDSPDRYKVSKQADVLMLLYLLGDQGLRDELSQMGYDVDAAALERAIAYYRPRTTHGSSLSRMVDTWVLARTQGRGAWTSVREFILDAIEHAADDTTSEGIHLGAMAGALDIVQRCYAGVEVEADHLVVRPRLPDGVDRIRMPLLHRGTRLELAVFRDHVLIHVFDGRLRLRIDERIHVFHPGERRRVDLERR